VPPPPLVPGGRGTLAGERGGESGRVPVPTKGHTLWYSLYLYFVSESIGRKITHLKCWAVRNEMVSIFLHVRASFDRNFIYNLKVKKNIWFGARLGKILTFYQAGE
jgi:hypothetical protein